MHVVCLDLRISCFTDPDKELPTAIYDRLIPFIHPESNPCYFKLIVAEVSKNKCETIFHFATCRHFLETRVYPESAYSYTYDN